MSDVLDTPDVPPVVPKKRGGGPKTPEGKARAKFNSMKHGLRAKVLLPSELVAAYEGHKAELTRQFAPATRYEAWLVGEMAMAMARLDRCADMAVCDLQRCLDIAEFDWDDDRKGRAEDLGRRLPKDPSRVAQALEQSTHGTDWMIARWEGIRGVLATGGEADEGLRGLAYDLLGVPLDLRSGAHRVPAAGDAAGLSRLAGEEISRLRVRQERCLDDRDEARRSMAMVGMPYDEDPETARLRRYESSIRRALDKARAELLRVRDDSAPAREATAAREARPPGPSLLPSMAGAIGQSPAAREPSAGAETGRIAAVVRDEVPAAMVATPSSGTTKVPSQPVVSGSSCSSAKTAAYRTAAPRNRHEKRAAQARARKEARAAAN